jgi:protocatechuate 3,4-dioxygenase beta subunit
MMSFTRQAIVCLLLIAGVAVCGHAQITSSKESTASISGKVTVKGEGVAGVIVTLRSNENLSSQKLTSYRGVTDAKGEYRIANVSPGSYKVITAAAALIGEDRSNGERNIIVNKDETIENVDFSLIRGGVITGKVVDSDGRPVIEEEVYLSSASDPAMRSPRPDAITDDRGVYRIFALRPGSYTVAAGTDSISRTFGRPAGALYSRSFYHGISDPAQATVIQVSDGSEATNVDIVLGRTLTTHTVRGRVVNGATGQPMPNASYSVTHFVSPTYTTTISQGSVTNSQGEFKLENLIPGQYAIAVRPEHGGDWRAEDLRFEIVDQDVNGLVVRTGKGASLSGVVVFEGVADQTTRERLRNTRVIISVLPDGARSSSGPSYTSDVGADGSFHAGGLPPGTALVSLAGPQKYRIVRVEREGIVQARGIEVKQAEDINAVRVVVAYADASLRGVLTIENGSLPPNGRLFLWLRRLDNTSGLLIDGSPQIDARGQFVVDNLFPGGYELIAGIFIRGSRTPLVQTKQEIVVTNGSSTNTAIKLNLNPPQPQP